MSATVVNTLPWPLREPKPGLVPSIYEISAAPKGDISILTVEDGYHFVYIPLSGDKTPPMRVMDPANNIARGIVEDYVNSSIFISRETDGIDGIEKVPGLFWVEGDWNVVGIKAKFAKQVEKALKQTRAWFATLVQIADDDWAKNRQNKEISDVQRHACRYLSLKREWDQDIINQRVEPVQTIACFACKSLAPQDAILCPNCKVILNMAEFEKKKAHFQMLATK